MAESRRRSGIDGPVLSRAVDPLVRGVGGLPVSVHAKLLVAFVGTVVLLVVLGVLGLRVLSDSNDRVNALGALQQRATKYRELQTDAVQLRLLLGMRAGGEGTCAYSGDCPAAAAGGPSPIGIDEAIIALPLSRLGQVTNPTDLGFVPPPDEQSTLAEIGQDNEQLTQVMRQILTSDVAGDSGSGLRLQGAQAEPLAQEVLRLTADLASTTQGVTDALVVQNRSLFGTSELLFVAVAAASIVLALLLGYVLSWSIVGPLRKMETRLTAIASGDFSGHVDVANRDELGALAADINRMNDELARLYDELAAASRHKSEFLATMSHELRTPLNAIIGFSQVLREQMFGELNERQTDYLDDILSSGQHLLTLINDILDLAKVEAGRLELQPSSFSLAGALDSALVMVRERATRQEVRLSSDIDPSVGEIEADERKVKQILFNLLSNAVKFTPAGGAIELSARPDGDQVVIAVRDTGVGIPAEEQARIFDEFYQVGPGRAQEGTGLGLALTRRLVELHGGRLDVASEPGVGSTFSVHLPLRQTVPEVVSEVPAQVEARPA